MGEYLIQSETLTSIADPIRELNGIENALTPSEMVTKLRVINDAVISQANLISQISTTLESKMSATSIDTCTVVVVSNSSLIEASVTTYVDGVIAASIQNSMENGDGTTLTFENVILGSVITITTFTAVFLGVSMENGENIGRLNKNRGIVFAKSTGTAGSTTTITIA